MPVLFFITFNCSSFLSSIIFSLYKSSSFLSSFLQSLTKALPNREYSNLACPTTLGLYPKYWPVKYSYFSNSPNDNADILAVNLSTSY